MENIEIIIVMLGISIETKELCCRDLNDCLLYRIYLYIYIYAYIFILNNKQSFESLQHRSLVSIEIPSITISLFSILLSLLSTANRFSSLFGLAYFNYVEYVSKWGGRYNTVRCTASHLQPNLNRSLASRRF